MFSESFSDFLLLYWLLLGSTVLSEDLSDHLLSWHLEGYSVISPSVFNQFSWFL